MGDRTPPRILRLPMPPAAPARPARPPPLIIPPRRLNFNNGNRRPVQMNPGGSPGRRRNTRRNRSSRKSRKSRR